MLSNKDFCDKDTCVALKEMAYKGMSRYYYTQRDHNLHYDAYNKFYTVRTADAMGYVLAIHLYDAQQWLRDEKNIIVEVFIDDDSDTPITYNIYKDREYVCHHNGKYWSVKEWSEALLEGIKEAVKILKESKTEEKDYKEFVSLVKRMRKAQKDVIYESVFSALDSARPTAYEVAKTKQIILEQEVDEYLKIEE